MSPNRSQWDRFWNLAVESQVDQAPNSLIVTSPSPTLDAERQITFTGPTTQDDTPTKEFWRGIIHGMGQMVGRLLIGAVLLALGLGWLML